MRVTHLSLTDFRNYAHAEVELAPGPNLFVGSNGQGKTNLVESLVFVSTGSSHRTPVDAAMIRQEASAAVIRARLEHDGRAVLLELQQNRGSANKAMVNRSSARPRDLVRYLSTVLFAPEDLALVRGEPAVRRRLLDTVLVQHTPRLAGVLADYDRVLRQRNTLLKSARASGVRGSALSTLDVWDERLVGLGSEIIDERSALIADLREPVRDAYRAVAGGDHDPRLVPLLSVDGAAPDDDDSADGSVEDAEIARGTTRERFADAVARLRSRELERGVTLVGPHRDDVRFELNGLPAKGYASHGESWSFALALRLASAHLLRAHSTTGDPVLILDDVFAELDQARRARLAASVHDFEQVLVTSAVLDDVPDELRAHTVHIRAGRVIDPDERSDEGERGTHE
ncbi:DNA replication/repair protein RecF [Humibacter ginsenosidimutans]|uniref:DNA replication and repair protein RecF n=1 Tax=Humibacter ginsenosidimutans TaxID=2599293 RepID=A0A5B8M597_9MICO|nr:DNA replication/repair protein RecF [Humibacter ginsenosidimutans]QDZ15543.1 DNA replication/repair protein RecF [Humibacter ginsenosidimutans]